MFGIRILITLIFIVTNLTFCFSQTIINTERNTISKDSTLLSVALSYYGTRGNSDVDRFSISPIIQFICKKNDYTAFGGYSLLSNSQQSILKNAYVHLRHHYKISPRLKIYEFFQTQFNEILLLEKREVIGFGLRYSIFNKDSLNLNLSFGPMHEYEKLNVNKVKDYDNSETNYYRGNGTISFNWLNKNPINIHNVLYYQPRLSDFRDYRMLNEFNFVFRMTEHFSFLLEFITRFDSTPPSTLKEVDHIMTFGISLKY